MKTFYIIFLIYFFTVCNSYSQFYTPEWAVTYNAYESSVDGSFKIAVDSAGNVYVTGESWAFDTQYDYLTVKYNTSGVLLWQSRYNGTGNYTDEPVGIVVDKLGNVYVTGYSYGGSSDYDYATVKYNSNGVQQWVDRYNGPADSTDKANSIALDKSGNVYVTGGSINSSNYKYDCTTIKYSPSGIRLWVNRYEYIPTFNCWGKFVKVDSAGNVYLGGDVGSFDGNISRNFTLKYNNSGIQQWNNYVSSNNQISDLELDIYGNTYLSNFNDVYKFNSSGTLTNNQTLGGVYATSLDKSGNFYAIVHTGQSYVLYKFNNNMIIQWTTTYIPIGIVGFYASDIEIDTSENVYITGASNYITTGYDFVTIKYNSSGIKQWVSRFIGSVYEDNPYDLALDYNGNIYVTGHTFAIGTEEDFLTIKYPSSIQLNATILIEGFYKNVTNRLNRKDTITAYLRQTSFPYAITDSGKAVIDTLSFKCGFCFNYAPAGTYYIVIKHRNSIETWSKAGGEVFSKSIPTTYNFTTSSSQAYGNNLKLKGSKYCIFSGNVNGDAIVDGSDLSEADNDSFAGMTGVFLRSDVNGDNIVDAEDVSLVDNNSFNSIVRITP
ncbi:MAG: SBBP repeat-containing protein [Ignavibacteria bacterium]|nr:SBBP repeat-containing protein [Ignavibacteria bacterium]